MGVSLSAVDQPDVTCRYSRRSFPSGKAVAFVCFGKSSWNFSWSGIVCRRASVAVYVLKAVEKVCFVRCKVELLFNNISFLLILGQKPMCVIYLCYADELDTFLLLWQKNGAGEQDAEWVFRGTREMAFLVKLLWTQFFGQVSVRAHSKDGRHGQQTKSWYFRVFVR